MKIDTSQDMQFSALNPYKQTQTLNFGPLKPELQTDNPSTPFKTFDEFLQDAKKPTVAPEHEQADDLMEAAGQMETHLVTFMLKTMDAAGDNGGLLGSRSQGMGYFKDLFFEKMAEEVVASQGLGFAQALKNTYNPGTTAKGPGRLG